MPPACFLTPKPIGCTPRAVLQAAYRRQKGPPPKPSGGNELSRLRQSERSAAWADAVTPPRLGAGDHRSPLRGARRPGAPFPSHISRLGISEARHRRRPGGPSWHSAAAHKACRVIPMRAARGAAAPVTEAPRERAAMRGWSLQAKRSPPPPWTPGSGPAGPGGFPAAFDIKSGAPAGQARSPGGSRKMNGASGMPRPTTPGGRKISPHRICKTGGPSGPPVCVWISELRVAHRSGVGQGPARPAAPGSRRDDTCSAEINSACAKVLPAGKTLVRRKAPPHLRWGPDVLPGTAGRMPGFCLSFLELRVAYRSGVHSHGSPWSSSVP